MKMTGSKVRSVFAWAVRGVMGLAALVGDVIRRVTKARVSEAAATMAYYALFSLFPLLVVLVVAASYVLESERAFQVVVEAVGGAFPGSRQLIEENVHQVIRLRGPVGLIGLVTLLWSASSFFSLLSHNIERAWPDGSARSAIHRRLLALAIVVGLALLLVLSLLANAALENLPWEDFAGRLTALGEPLWSALSSALPWALAFLMFLSLYRWMPNTRVSWRGALWGAAAVTALWLLAGQAFLWYLGSGLAHYELVYGSIGAVIVLMLWIYVTSWVTLAGAHLTAAICRRGAQPEAESRPMAGKSGAATGSSSGLD
jgi:membrane protein